MKNIYITMMIIMSGFFVACSGGSENKELNVITGEDFNKQSKYFSLTSWRNNTITIVNTSVGDPEDEGMLIILSSSMASGTYVYTPAAPAVIDPGTGEVIEPEVPGTTAVMETIINEGPYKDDALISFFGFNVVAGVTMDSEMRFTFNFDNGTVAVFGENIIYNILGAEIDRHDINFTASFKIINR